MAAAPFQFSARPSPVAYPTRLVDEANGLECWRRGGPDYTYDLVVRESPEPGLVDAEPAIYLQLCFESLVYSPRSKLWGAKVEPEFHQRYPERLAELLDVVLPLVVPFMNAPFEGAQVGYEPLPERLRSSLLEKGSYGHLDDDWVPGQLPPM